MKGSRLLLIFMFILTAVLGAGAIWIGTRLSKQEEVSPEESEAASEQVWNAEIFSKDNIKTYFPDAPDVKSAMEIWANTWRQKEEQNVDFQEGYKFAVGDGGRFVQDQEVIKVGEEKLYGRDLNYFLFIYFYEAFTSSSPLEEATLNAALDMMIEQSLILQTALKEKYIKSLDSDVYNTVEKDLEKRSDLVYSNLERVKKSLVQTITFEQIRIYFDNVVLDSEKGLVSSRSSSITKEDAKKTAETKMKALYQKLNKGEITMEEAGTLIIGDGDLYDIDSAYVQNAYSKSVDIPKDFNPFSSDNSDQMDQKLFGELWALGEGQLSKVLTNESDTAYVILKVLRRTGSTSSPTGYDEYLTETKDSTDITYEVKK